MSSSRLWGKHPWQSVWCFWSRGKVESFPNSAGLRKAEMYFKDWKQKLWGHNFSWLKPPESVALNVKYCIF